MSRSRETLFSSTLPGKDDMTTELSCEGWGGLGGTLQLGVPMMIATIQALQFAMENRVQYLQSYQCEDCFNRVGNMHKLLADLLEKIEEQRQTIILQNAKKKLTG